MTDTKKRKITRMFFNLNESLYAMYRENVGITQFRTICPEITNYAGNKNFI